MIRDHFKWLTRSLTITLLKDLELRPPLDPRRPLARRLPSAPPLPSVPPQQARNSCTVRIGLTIAMEILFSGTYIRMRFLESANKLYRIIYITVIIKTIKYM